MRDAIVTELDVETGKRRCRRRDTKRVIDHEPDDAKGGRESARPKHGAIRC